MGIAHLMSSRSKENLSSSVVGHRRRDQDQDLKVIISDPHSGCQICIAGVGGWEWEKVWRESRTYSQTQAILPSNLYGREVDNKSWQFGLLTMAEFWEQEQRQWPFLHSHARHLLPLPPSSHKSLLSVETENREVEERDTGLTITSYQDSFTFPQFKALATVEIALVGEWGWICVW